MNRDDILSVIRDYADRYLEEPSCRLTKNWFKQKSYSRWAVNELIRSIKESKTVPPILVVEDFIRKMDAFSVRNTKASFMFSVAHDVAENILDILIDIK